MEYRKRIIDTIIDYYKDIVGCLYIKGPRWCGKTTTAESHAKTTYRLSNKRNLDNLKAVFESDPETVFQKEKPILFDEWQLLPELWDQIKTNIDENFGEGGQFLLTGSSDLSDEERDEKILHSGTGRFLDLFMRPMSLYESGESNGNISLFSLLEPGFKVNGLDSDLSLKDLIHATCRGGWPRAVSEPDKEKSLLYPGLVVDRLLNGGEKIFGEGDGGEALGRVDPDIMHRILSAYSRNDCTLVSNSKILNLARGNDVIDLDRNHYDAYKRKLVSRYIIEEVESWCPAFKSRANMSTSNKKCFVDPSLPISILGLSPEKLLDDLIDYGFFFENLAIRELRIYSGKEFGKVYYYHDRTGNEVDAVVVFRDNRYALVEIKLGFPSALKAANGLLKIKSLIEKHNLAVEDKSALMEMPSAYIVLHAGKEALTLSNGVHIVPIGSLRD